MTSITRRTAFARMAAVPAALAAGTGAAAATANLASASPEGAPAASLTGYLPGKGVSPELRQRVRAHMAAHQAFSVQCDNREQADYAYQRKFGREVYVDLPNGARTSISTDDIRTHDEAKGAMHRWRDDPAAVAVITKAYRAELRRQRQHGVTAAAAAYSAAHDVMIATARDVMAFPAIRLADVQYRARYLAGKLGGGNGQMIIEDICNGADDCVLDAAIGLHTIRRTRA
jgi:hypothetical protein